MTPKKHKRKKGFSLIETLVYIAIVVSMTVLVVSIFISTAKAINVLTISRNINNSALSSMERLTRDIKEASDIIVASSTLNVHPGVLALQKSATTTEFYLVGDVLFVKENNIEIGPLTQQGASITNLVFNMLDNGTTKGVKIEMTISDSYKDIVKTKTFYSFAVLRN